jgi:hypothetical protein
LEEVLKIVQTFIEALDEHQKHDNSEKRYPYVSPFDMLRRTLIASIRDGLPEEEAVRLSADRMVSDVERDWCGEKNAAEFEKLRNAGLILAHLLYVKYMREFNGSLAKLLKYTNFMRDHIYVSRYINYLKKR